MIFPRNKPAPVQYIVDTVELESNIGFVPKGIYPDIEKQHAALDIGCPAMAAANNKLFDVFSPCFEPCFSCTILVVVCFSKKSNIFFFFNHTCSQHSLHILPRTFNFENNDNKKLLTQEMQTVSNEFIDKKEELIINKKYSIQLSDQMILDIILKEILEIDGRNCFIIKFENNINQLITLCQNEKHEWEILEPN